MELFTDTGQYTVQLPSSLFPNWYIQYSRPQDTSILYKSGYSHLNPSYDSTLTVF